MHLVARDNKMVTCGRGQPEESAPPVLHMRDAQSGNRISRQSVDAFAVECDAAVDVPHHQTADGTQEARLARAVRTQQCYYPHFGRQTFGDLAAEVQNHQPLRQAYHQAHVMLDEQHAHRKLFSQRSDQITQRVHLFVVETACRFIKQQKFRLRGQCASQLDVFLCTKGKVCRGSVCTGRKAKTFEQLVRFRLDAPFFGAALLRAQCRSQHARASPAVAANLDVVANAQAPK